MNLKQPNLNLQHVTRLIADNYGNKETMTRLEQKKELLKYIHKDVDGFYYFLPKPLVYSAYTLRLAAELLDEMNAVI